MNTLVRIGDKLINLDAITHVEQEVDDSGISIYTNEAEMPLVIDSTDKHYQTLRKYFFEMPSHEKVFDIHKLVKQTENLYALWSMEDQIMEENNKLKVKQLEAKLAELKKVNAGIEKHGFEKYFTEIRPREENQPPFFHPGLLN